MTPAEASVEIEKLCRLAPVIPVLVIEDARTARPLAEALVRGGLPVLEVTLRTDAAIEAISEMARIDGGVVGAGTLLTPADIKAAKAAGALFGVTPGTTDALVDAARAETLPLLPGAATATEALSLLEKGYSVQKFFPAGPAGGAKYLKALSAPLPQVRFCPTGGVSLTNAADYLSLPNVLCVGGSWVVPTDLVAAGDWDAVTELARQAATLPR